MARTPEPALRLSSTGRSTRLPVLVLGSGITALGVLRTLGRRGNRAYPVGQDEPLLRRSWYYRRLPGSAGRWSAGQDLPGFLARLPLERAILLPCSDSAVRAVAALDPALQGRFSSFLSPLPVLDRFLDKEQFATLARAAEVPHPRTRPIGSSADIAGIPEPAFLHGFLKPRDSQAFFARFQVKAFWVPTREMAMRRFEQVVQAGLAVQFQEYVPGPPTAHLFLDGFVDDAGRIRALLARRRLRMFPEDFGNSTAMETVDPGSVTAAVEALERLVTTAGFRGIFSAEFKQNAEDGQYYVLEVNVRPWWYVAFAARAGIDVCDWYVRAAAGESEPAPAAYRSGLRCVYPYYDVSAVGALRKRGEAGWADFLSGLLGASQPVWELGDPLPGLMEAFGHARSWLTPRRWKATA